MYLLFTDIFFKLIFLIKLKLKIMILRKLEILNGNNKYLSLLDNIADVSSGAEINELFRI